jgi:hypothetical protein
VTRLEFLSGLASRFERQGRVAEVVGQAEEKPPGQEVLTIDEVPVPISFVATERERQVVDDDGRVYVKAWEANYVKVDDVVVSQGGADVDRITDKTVKVVNAMFDALRTRHLTRQRHENNLDNLTGVTDKLRKVTNNCVSWTAVVDERGEIRICGNFVYVRLPLTDEESGRLAAWAGEKIALVKRWQRELREMGLAPPIDGEGDDDDY